MLYKNFGKVTKTFYGVEFKPGEVKDVPRFIVDRWFARVDEPEVKVEAKPTTEEKSARRGRPKKQEEEKVEIEEETLEESVEE